MPPREYKVIEWFWVAEDLHVRAIRTSQSKYWYLQYQQPGHGPGRQRRKSLRTTATKEARLRGLRFARSLEAGHIPTASQGALTVEKILALRIERLESDGAAPSTILLNKWYGAMLCQVLPRKGQTSIMQLTPMALTAFARTLRTTGVAVPFAHEPTQLRPCHPLSPRTVRDVLKGVRSLTRLAKSLKLIEVDPTEGFVLPKGPSPEIETFSREELAQIFADPAFADIWRFLSHTALRLEELCWLTKADVICGRDSHPTAIHIRHKTCPQTGVRWWPKHKIERIVPIGRDDARILLTAMAASSGPWVFAAPDVESMLGARKWRGRNLRKALDRRLQICKIAHGSPHVFRHTCASYLANTAKMPITLLQRFLGHQSLESTMRYLHASHDDVARAVLADNFASLSVPANDSATASADHLAIEPQASSSGSYVPQQTPSNATTAESAPRVTPPAPGGDPEDRIRKERSP